MTRRNSTLDEILDVQRDWATRAGKVVDAKGYMDFRNSNLFQPLSKTIEESLVGGAGSELDGKNGVAPKFNALHSSSVLAVNVFAYWEDKDSHPLTEALGIGTASGSPRFEEKFETGLRGTPPHLDVVLLLNDEWVFAIESKFTEWLTPKSTAKPAFRVAYFSPEKNLWSRLGLQKCQKLAEDIREHREVFLYLDAPQLLKHVLGLAKQTGGRFSLGYLYFDWGGGEGESHRNEIEQFRRRVGDEIRFVPMSYQTMFRRLTKACDPGHIEYLNYLRERYFSDAGSD